MPDVPTAMRFAGSELFVTMGTRFRVIDVATPNALIMLGTEASGKRTPLPTNRGD